MPHYFGSNIHNTGESCGGAIEGCSVSLSFFFSGKFLFVFFFLKNVGNVLSLLFKKCSGLNRSETGKKSLLILHGP